MRAENVIKMEREFEMVGRESSRLFGLIPVGVNGVSHW